MALAIQSPANNALVGAGPVQVQVRLVANPNYASTTQYPDTLDFSASRNDGGSDVGSFGPVSRNEDTYTVTWTPPSAQAQLTLTVAHPTPAAVPSASVTVKVDAVAPTFTISIPDPTRIPGGPNQAEPRDSDTDYAKAYRRDESVTVAISANEPVSDVVLTVSGIASGGGVGQALTPKPVQAGGTCEGSPVFCGTATVDLYEPEMREFRGTMQFRVEGVDAAGNRGSATAGLKVTRWKWAFDGAGLIKASPALGEKGVVYFGTSVTNGKVFAIEPSGKKKWEVDVEAVEGSPAVGAFSNGTELVYVASNFAGVAGIGSGTRLRAINGELGTVLNTPCTFPVATGTPPSTISSAAITATTISSTPVETGLFVVSGNYGSAVGLRPTSVGANAVGCVNSDSSQGMPNSTAGGGLVATNTGQFAYPTDARRMVKYSFGTPAAQWTATPGGGSGQRVFGMALLVNTLLGSGGNDFDQGGVFQVAFDSTGTPPANALPDTDNGRVNQLVATADNKAYFGREYAGPSNLLARYDLSVPALSQASPAPGVLSAAPVIGSDGKLYTVNKSGELAVWTTSDPLSSQWKLPSIGLNIEASPTLDCARGSDGAPLGANRPGVLYVAVGNKLHAFVVDSPRLLKDPNSWPKFQHDVRNTGNPSTPITNCP
ncbi:PQQ-binding-like beta-propeller repeat protein [Hyalangium minutum]|nr:PQQ-binding-like beta-propeller repeat protein [Hyalangium minutum]